MIFSLTFCKFSGFNIRTFQSLFYFIGIYVIHWRHQQFGKCTFPRTIWSGKYYDLRLFYLLAHYIVLFLIVELLQHVCRH